MTSNSAKAPRVITTARTSAARRSQSAGDSRTRQSLETLLPGDVRAELTLAAAGMPCITPKDADDLDRRLEVTKNYGVSRRRLLNYLRRLHKTCGPPEAKPASLDPPAKEATPEKLRAHRLRQKSVAAILDAVFGPLGKQAPELWERRAYLLLVGLVYERLATGDGDPSTEELAKLAKVLAENRRFEVRLKEAKPAEDSSESPPSEKGQLPERFGELVRQVYGTNFHAPQAEPDGERPSTATAES